MISMDRGPSTYGGGGSFEGAWSAPSARTPRVGKSHHSRIVEGFDARGILSKALKKEEVAVDPRQAFEESGLGQLKALSQPLRDNGGKELPCKWLLETDDIHAAAALALKLDMGIVVMGALTSATKNFGPEEVNYKAEHNLNGVIGIRPKRFEDGNETVEDAAERTDADSDSELLRTDQIHVRKNSLGEGRHTVVIGAGATFEDVNRIIRRTLGRNYYVPIDLTTKATAFSGAVYATSAQGPSRFRVSDLAQKVTMTNGAKVNELTGDGIKKHEGMVGVTGGVLQMELEVLEVPEHRFGVGVALQDAKESNWEEKAAPFVSALMPLANVKAEKGKLISAWKEGLVDGLEIFTRKDLEFILGQAVSDEVQTEARKLLTKLDAANSDMMILMTGRSEKPLVDTDFEDANNPLVVIENLSERNGDRAAIVGGDMASYLDAGSMGTVTQLREDIPLTARSYGEAKDGRIVRSTSTDFNTSIDHNVIAGLAPEDLQMLIHAQFEPFLAYEQSVETLRTTAEAANIDLRVHRYGHMNPMAINLHTRVTLRANDPKTVDQQVFDTLWQQIQGFKAQLAKAIQALPKQDNRINTGFGEKGKLTSEAGPLLTEGTRAEIAETLAASSNNWTFRAPPQWKAAATDAANDTPVEIAAGEHRAEPVYATA